MLQPEKTTPRVRGTTPEIEAMAREMRRSLTPSESLLWQSLRRRRLGGFRFRCQHPVGPFVLDFYCPACRLVVEVDGPVHEAEKEQDQARTQQLNAYGYRVLRFHNEEVFNSMDAVLERILQAAQHST